MWRCPVSDPSTREQIRAEAVERIARGEFTFEARPLTPAPGEWAALPSPVQDRYRRRAAVLVDALGDLLPTAMEGRFIGRGMLRRTRYVTDWQEPEEAGR